MGKSVVHVRLDIFLIIVSRIGDRGDIQIMVVDFLNAAVYYWLPQQFYSIGVISSVIILHFLILSILRSFSAQRSALSRHPSVSSLVEFLNRVYFYKNRELAECWTLSLEDKIFPYLNHLETERLSISLDTRYPFYYMHNLQWDYSLLPYLLFQVTPRVVDISQDSLLRMIMTIVRSDRHRSLTIIRFPKGRIHCHCHFLPAGCAAHKNCENAF